MLHARPLDQPEYVATGTYGETEALVESLLGMRPWGPTPRDVLPGNRVWLDMEERFFQGSKPERVRIRSGMIG